MQIFSYVCCKISFIIDDFCVIHYTKSVTYRQLYQNISYYIGLVFSYLIEVITNEKIIGS